MTIINILPKPYFDSVSLYDGAVKSTMKYVVYMNNFDFMITYVSDCKRIRMY